MKVNNGSKVVSIARVEPEWKLLNLKDGEKMGKIFKIEYKKSGMICENNITWTRKIKIE